MNSSPTITKIAAALVKAQTGMANAKKDAENPFFKKKYADLNSIREAGLPALNANGITAIQPTCVIDGVSYVETILLHESGEYISSLSPIISASINDPQKHGSGLSYARRYALQSILNIGAEDDDANEATKQPAPVKQVVDKKDLATAIKMVNSAKTIEELVAHKKSLPEIIVTDASFKDAGNKKYTLLMAEKPATT